MTMFGMMNGRAMVRAVGLIALACLSLFTVAACQSSSAVMTPQQLAVAAPAPQTADELAQTYILGPGDKLRVIVFNEQDLSGEFEVDSTGTVSLPLIEPVKAAGGTVRQFQAALVEKFSNGYLVNPRVSVEVVNYRPFYITGEVNRPGEYPYVAGMNLLKAIAMAGGTTYRANTTKAYLTRLNSGEELVVEPTPEVLVMPGDFIRIPERFF